jgi:ketosteroid isomerase-like protein
MTTSQKEGPTMLAPTEVFDRVIRSMLATDAAAYADLFAPDAIVEWPFALDGWPKRVEGRDAIRAHVANVFVRFREAGRLLVGVRDTIFHPINVHDFAVEFSIEATGPNGVAVALPYVQFFRLTDDGLIASLRDYFRPMANSAPPTADTSRAAR